MEIGDHTTNYTEFERRSNHNLRATDVAVDTIAIEVVDDGL